jgi:hypothetical protein
MIRESKKDDRQFNDPDPIPSNARRMKSKLDYSALLSLILLT